MIKQSSSHELRTASLESPGGLRVTILNRGATIAAIELPAAGGHRNVVLSYPHLEAYGADRYYLGATVGPFANRIRGARFHLGDEHFALDANEAETGHCLHGGASGLHQQMFTLSTDEDAQRIECRAELPDGQGGFPGNRVVTIEYQLLNECSLVFDYRVSSDRDTIVSLANHAYFNLGGKLSDHEIAVCADSYLPVDDSNAPTGEILEVAGSRFDLRRPAALGQQRFDHNFVLPASGNEPHLAAVLRSPDSGLQLDLLTTQPGLQLYTGEYLAAPFAPRQALCLEAQAFPDAPNQPAFPSAVLAAGATYWQRSIYEFSGPALDCKQGKRTQ